jgi:hypothetical protein
MWMNQYDVEDAVTRYGNHEILGPAVLTLGSLMNWTNGNSDGWAYWQKPSKAAEKLMTLVQDHERWERSEYRHPREGAEATSVALKAALRPIKAFRTKHAKTLRNGCDFEIFETKADIQAAVLRRAEAVEAAERTELARLQEKYMSNHIHNGYTCPAHVKECDCPDKVNSVCNPYHVPGFCPDNLTVMEGLCPLDREPERTC